MTSYRFCSIIILIGLTFFSSSCKDSPVSSNPSDTNGSISSSSINGKGSSVGKSHIGGESSVHSISSERGYSQTSAIQPFSSSSEVESSSSKTVYKFEDRYGLWKGEHISFYRNDLRAIHRVIAELPDENIIRSWDWMDPSQLSTGYAVNTQRLTLNIKGRFQNDTLWSGEWLVFRTSSYYSVPLEARLVKHARIPTHDSVVYESDDTGYLIDGRDGQYYNWKRVGDALWMETNLNYRNQDLDFSLEEYALRPERLDGSVYNGLLYSWTSAMTIDESYNNKDFTLEGNHRGICPLNWHIPSNAEIQALIDEFTKGTFSVNTVDTIAVTGAYHPYTVSLDTVSDITDSSHTYSFTSFWGAEHFAPLKTEFTNREWNHASTFSMSERGVYTRPTDRNKSYDSSVRCVYDL